MHLAIITLAAHPLTADRSLDTQVLIDALWAMAQPSDGIEHISAKTGTRHAQIGLYLLADSQANAERRAYAVLERAIASARLLHGWHISPPPTSP